MYPRLGVETQQTPLEMYLDFSIFIVLFYSKLHIGHRQGWNNLQ